MNGGHDKIKLGLREALEYVKSACKAKFDSTIEVHVNTLLNKSKQETVRFDVTLPHGTGKTRKIAVMASKPIEGADLELGEADLERIQSGQLKPKVHFDVLIAEPKYMAKLAKVAKILGPAGAMPSPKNGTVTDDVQKTLGHFRKGKIEVRSEPNGLVIHTIIGKKSFTTEALAENFQELISSIEINKPAKARSDWIKSVYLSATMSPSVEVVL